MLSEKKIALVEDDPIIRDLIIGFLKQYNISLIFDAENFETGIEKLHSNLPELILLDIRLGEEKSGIMLATYIRKHFPKILIIFITSLTDNETITMASVVDPDGYIVKPFRAEDLNVAIELAFRKKQSSSLMNPMIISQEIFVKNGHNLDKLVINEITCLQAEGNYVKIHMASGKNLLIRTSLKDFVIQLPEKQFIQIHKSWIVNLMLVKSVSSNQVIVANTTIPLSPNFRDLLIERLKVLG